LALQNPATSHEHWFFVGSQYTESPRETLKVN
jgi:hypothetical protein